MLIYRNLKNHCDLELRPVTLKLLSHTDNIYIIYFANKYCSRTNEKEQNMKKEKIEKRKCENTHYTKVHIIIKLNQI